MKVETTIKDFKEYLSRIKMYQEAMATLSFDGETVAPTGSVTSRAKRAGFFALELFNMSTSEQMKTILDALAPYVDEMDDVLKAEYRDARKEYEDGVKIPADVVRELSELSEESASVWATARAENDFAKFAPYLKRMIELQKKVIDYRRNEELPYDVLLDDYESGMTMEVYDQFFDKLKTSLVPLLAKIKASNKQINRSFVNAVVGLDKQKQISDFVAQKIGFDFERGLITESTHPFCNGSNKYDVRMTTRYLEDDFLSSFYSVMHETGHGIYEQNIGDDITHTIVGGGTSMGIHESQSRFYENILGRSEVFWQAIYPELKKLLPTELQNVTAYDFYEAVNVVEPSFIRVEADELTYNLHIIIRYEMERMLFNEEVQIEDLPAIWNKKYEEYLGITPDTDTIGVLQDVHWSFGLFGYFPTYVLGSAYGAQIAAHMKKDLDFDKLVEAQDFETIKNWLVDKIHQYGKVYQPNELMEKSFGEKFNADYYIDYLVEKYTKLYELD